MSASKNTNTAKTKLHKHAEGRLLLNEVRHHINKRLDEMETLEAANFAANVGTGKPIDLSPAKGSGLAWEVSYKT
jgi:hypothetical protein